MTDKKDILEFPLEDVEVPQAIALMMQAATKCVDGVKYDPSIDIDNERLQQLCEKLEARVEDAIEAGLPQPDLDDVPDEEAVEEADIHLMNEGLTMNYKGLLFHRTCNERVQLETDIQGATYCALPVDHNSLDHIDSEGEHR